ncbi:MAG: PAN domain-containing protein, partial [Paracoccaceae bacterium]|nr:PAN domain-containing protein [Paracoccaceae bacterium]
MRILFLSVIAGLITLSLSASATAQDLVPAKRFVLNENADLPGGDIGAVFDTTLEACERACLANKSCTAFTFNTRNGSCFPKAGPGAEAFYQGAVSGRVITADTAVITQAPARRGELGFLPDWDISAAFAQATGLAGQHVSGSWTAQEHLQSAAEAEARGDHEQASRFTGSALNLTDAAGSWADYARLLLLAADADRQAPQSFRERAFAATINAYLRAQSPALRHSVLVTMGDALEKLGRGRDTVQALRLAQSLQPRDDTAVLLDAAAGKYGFRIVENEVQSDTARPRICATFSEDLLASGVDYGSFVQLPEAGLTVEAAGRRQLCVEGLAHGTRYALTFRQGLPAADGQVLAKSVPLTLYVRDRSPGVRFAGRAYVLPKTGNAALPVETVNTENLDLTLFRVDDRNLLRAMQDSYFGQPMADYQESGFAGQVGTQLWAGKATVGMQVNRDMTTRLPMDAAIMGLPAGVYALKAAVPGVDPYTVPAAWQWFVISDLGITTMSGTDGLHVFVRGLGDAGAKVGVSVDLLSRANAVLGTVRTDAIGYAHFDAGLVRGTGGAEPALVVVRDGADDLAFLSLSDPEFDLSDRGVEGREPAPPIDIFLTTDRGAYRAGETVNATALARDTTATAVAG